MAAYPCNTLSLCFLTALMTASPAIGQAANLPDLIIEDVRIDASQPSLLHVKVANIGLLAATQTELSLLIEREGVTHSTTVTTPLLKTGARQWLVVALGLRPLHTDRIMLRIDDPPRLEEANEINNGYLYPE
jgi:hypothetical protein